MTHQRFLLTQIKGQPLCPRDGRVEEGNVRRAPNIQKQFSKFHIDVEFGPGISIRKHISK